MLKSIGVASIIAAALYMIFIIINLISWRLVGQFTFIGVLIGVYVMFIGIMCIRYSNNPAKVRFLRILAVVSIIITIPGVLFGGIPIEFPVALFFTILIFLGTSSKDKSNIESAGDFLKVAGIMHLIVAGLFGLPMLRYVFLQILNIGFSNAVFDFAILAVSFMVLHILLGIFGLKYSMKPEKFGLLRDFSIINIILSAMIIIITSFRTFFLFRRFEIVTATIVILGLALSFLLLSGDAQNKKILPKQRQKLHYASYIAFIFFVLLPIGGYTAFYEGIFDSPLQMADVQSRTWVAPPLTQQSVAGDVISFGNHNWQILDIQDGKVLIITDTIIGRMPYHSIATPTTWRTSGMRRYLNNEFLNSFNMTDQARIIETTVINNNNPWHGTNAGRNTNDRIFLLSLDEVLHFFGYSELLANHQNIHRVNAPRFSDQYDTARIANDAAGNASSWWLRTTGDRSNGAVFIWEDGNLHVSGDVVYWSGHVGHGVRPALWLLLD